MIPLSYLPPLNASLNALSFVLILSGYAFIRRRKVAAHKACMLAACTASALFLMSYLYLHFHIGATSFTTGGWIRTAYLALLWTHMALAASLVPLVIVTLRRAFKEQFDRHRRIARWTLPIWLYVSCTGVLIYFMLYHWFPPTP